MKIIQKRAWSLLLCAAMVLALVPATAFAATEYAYVDEYGHEYTAVATEITSTTTTLDGGTTGGWYVVNGDVTINNGRIYNDILVNGDVKLILTDGYKFQSSSILVPNGASLTIYGQSGGTGELHANASISCAIGGGGTVTINGGKITATSNGRDAAIGGEQFSNGGAVIINGGTVNAKSNLEGAAIGCSVDGSNFSVTINGGTVTAEGGYGAGIGDAFPGRGSSVTINGGTVIATSNNSAGIGGAGSTVIITGGTVTTSSTLPAPKSGSGEVLYPAKVTLVGVSAITEITSLTIGSTRQSSLKDLYTDAHGAFCLWLPADALVTGATVDGQDYVGSVAANSAGTLTDNTVPGVRGVTPSGSGTAINGNITVTFSEAMDTSAGAVSLDGEPTSLTGGAWSMNDTVYTAPYSGLNYGTAYTVTVTGFKDTAGNTMVTNSSHGFTTVTEPLAPSVSPGTLTVSRGGTGSLTIAFGQGTTAATGASISVGNGSIASVSQNQVTAPGIITITGLKVGTTYITVTFNDTASTVKTASVIVQPVASAWSSGSGSSSSSSSSSGKTYQAGLSIGGGTSTYLRISVDSAVRRAYVELSSAQGKALADGGNLQITMPSVFGVIGYAVTLPGSYLTSEAGGTLTLKSDEGNITVPSNMLKSSGVQGQSATVAISQGDTATLSKELKAEIGDRPVIQLTLLVDGTQVEWNNPDAPVTVSIPYTPTAEELRNRDSIVVWYIDGSGKLVCVPNGHYDATTGTVTFETTHFSLYAVGYNPVSFNDVAGGAWYYDAVSFLSARSIASGTGNGNYSPDAKITRGEFIVMLMRAYGITEDTNPTDNFTDAGNSYYTGYLAAAKRLGIGNGVGNNLFAPEKQITSQEMFTLLYNVLKVIDALPTGTSGKMLSDFSDASNVAPWAKDAMALLVETGTISGNSGKLAPTSTTTRAEMAKVLYNLLSK